MIVLRHGDHIGLGHHVVDIPGGTRPIHRGAKFDVIAAAPPLDGLGIRRAAGGGGGVGGGVGEPGAGVIVVQAAGHGGGKGAVEDGQVGQIADGVEFQLPLAAADLIPDDVHRPIAVPQSVVVPAGGVAGQAVFQQIAAAVGLGGELQPLLFKEGDGGLNGIRGDQHPAVHVVQQGPVGGSVQAQGIPVAVEVELHPGAVSQDHAVIEYLVRRVDKLPGGILVDAQPQVFVLIFPQAHIGGHRVLVPANGVIGLVRLEHIARLRLPQPDQMGLAPVGGGEVHGHVGLPVAVEIVEGDTVKVVPGVGHGHGKFHAVIQQLLRPVPIESGALLVHRDHHVHALSVVGDGTAGCHKAGGAPIVPGHIPLSAAGGQGEDRSSAQDQGEVFTADVHVTAPF